MHANFLTHNIDLLVIVLSVSWTMILGSQEEDFTIQLLIGGTCVCVCVCVCACNITIILLQCILGHLFVV